MTPSSDQVIAKDGNVNFDCFPSGCCTPYTYSWSFQNGTSSSSTSQSSVATFGSSAEGNENTATVTVTDQNGATASANIKVRVPKVELISFSGSGGFPSYNSSTGTVQLGESLVAGMGMVVKVGVSGYDGQTTFEFVHGIRRSYTLTYTNGTQNTVYVTGSSSTYCLDNSDPYIPSINETGSGTFPESANDSPSIRFSDIPGLASQGVRKIVVQDSFEMFIGYKIPTYIPNRKGLGVLYWGWDATINVNPDGTSSLLLTESHGPGNPTGSSVSSIPTFGCTFLNN